MRTPDGIFSRGDIVATIVGTAFVLAVTSVAAGHQPQASALDPLGYGWLVLAGLPLLLARRFPISVFAVSTAMTLTYYWSSYPGGPVVVLPALALFTLTRLRGPVPAASAGGVLLLVLLGANLVSGWTWSFDARSAGLLAGIAAVIGIGTAVRNRVAAVRAARARETEHKYRLAEQERLSVAREVHDVLAHSLAMINVQAGVAAHVAERRPEQAQEALRNIKDASASALTDLRATLAVLRSGEGKEPTPSLRQISELVEHASATGLDVRVRGSPGTLPAPIDGAAYRIVQESLTNVVRHAQEATSVDVHFGRNESNFELVVRDDGVGATQPVTGNGLRGMRERAETLGGQVVAGVGDDGGFQVRAVLPIEGGFQ